MAQRPVFLPRRNRLKAVSAAVPHIASFSLFPTPLNSVRCLRFPALEGHSPTLISMYHILSGNATLFCSFSHFSAHFSENRRKNAARNDRAAFWKPVRRQNYRQRTCVRKRFSCPGRKNPRLRRGFLLGGYRWLRDQLLSMKIKSSMSSKASISSKVMSHPPFFLGYYYHNGFPPGKQEGSLTVFPKYGANFCALCLYFVDCFLTKARI